MLNDIARSFQLLAKGPAAENAEIESLRQYFGSVPAEYLEMVSEATEVELQHERGQYIRIWGPKGCVEMNEGYGIRNRIPDAFPIGDDGGGQVLFYADGNKGFGLYHVGYGNLERGDAKWIASSLREFLTNDVRTG